MCGFIGRQAIYNNSNDIVAYELLYRNDTNNSFPLNFNEDYATYDLIKSAFIISSASNYIGNKRAFINFTEKLLLDDIVKLLDKDQVVIEILETVNPTPEIREKILELKNEGYTLAFDDFVYSKEWDELIPHVDIIKIDLMETPLDKIKQHLIRIKSLNKNITLLAEKIENENELQKCKEFGFNLFQGYHLQKPEVLQVKTKEAKNSNKKSNKIKI